MLGVGRFCWRKGEVRACMCCFLLALFVDILDALCIDLGVAVARETFLRILDHV